MKYSTSHSSRMLHMYELGERLPAGQFLNNVLTLVREWLKSRNPENVNATLHCLQGNAFNMTMTVDRHVSMSLRKPYKVFSRGTNMFYTCSRKMKESIYN